MSNNKISWNSERDRGKTLLIVEGNHEKEKFFTKILNSFPEVNIDPNNIIVFRTNIYILLSKIIKEYGNDWFLQDIDLAYIVSKSNKDDITRHKNDYTNIFIIFDYERHDPNFTEEGITKLQEYFSDSTDVGKLYINYPMIESYMDLKQLPNDPDYSNRKVSLNVKNGSSYKNSIKNSIIHKLVYFPIKSEEILVERFQISEEVARNIVNNILEMNNIPDIVNYISKSLLGIVAEKDICTLTNQIKHIITSLDYINLSQSYISYMRTIYKYILIHNIKKASKIQFGNYDIDDNLIEFFERIDLCDILEKQNSLSQPTKSGEIWVLNTSILFLADYNTTLVIS